MADVIRKKFVVRKSVKKCNGAFECIFRFDKKRVLKRKNIYLLPVDHPIVQKLVKKKVLLKINDQTKKVTA